MKSLKNFIYENYSSRYLLNENLDDNLFWLLDKWFERNENQKSEFISILVQCRQAGDKVSIDNLEKLLHKTELKKDLKEFINFIDNDLEPQNNKDYLYVLKQIIELVIGKKEKNKYLDESQITEKLIINKNIKIDKYHYHPKDKDELYNLVHKLIKERGEKADLNDIDTSEITDMSYLFQKSNFNGDISKWNVSNVINMENMFSYSKFTGENGDISDWNVRNVVYMVFMFDGSNFNGDISEWDVRKVKNMDFMFIDSPLEKNPPKWYKEL